MHFEVSGQSPRSAWSSQAIRPVVQSEKAMFRQTSVISVEHVRTMFAQPMERTALEEVLRRVHS